MECPLESNGKTLQRPRATVIQVVWDSSTNKMSKKLSKNMWHSTRHFKNESLMTLKETTKWVVYFKTLEKHYIDTV